MLLSIFLYFCYFASTKIKKKGEKTFEFYFINLFLLFSPLPYTPPPLFQDWQNDIEKRKREEGAATPTLHHNTPCSTPPTSPGGATGFGWMRRPTLTNWEETELRPQWTQSKASRPSSLDLTSFSFLDSPPPPPSATARSNKRKKEENSPQSPPKRPRRPDTPLPPLPPNPTRAEVEVSSFVLFFLLTFVFFC